jgi:hypothetical protein
VPFLFHAVLVVDDAVKAMLAVAYHATGPPIIVPNVVHVVGHVIVSQNSSLAPAATFKKQWVNGGSMPALLQAVVHGIYRSKPAEPTMTEKLYTRVTKKFDPAAPTGVLVCAADLRGTYGFSENGYDSVEYDEEPDVYEVVLSVNRIADEEEAIAAARELGMPIYDTHGDFDQAVAEGKAKAGKWPHDYICLEEDPINSLLERDDFKAAMAEAAIGAIQDYVVITIDQPLLTMLWNPGTFRLKGPLEIVPITGADNAQQVRLAHDPAASISYSGPRR